MLDFDPLAPVYPSHLQDNDSLLRLKAMQADPFPYSPYTPPPIPLGKFAFNSPSTPPTPPFASSPGSQSFTFDPFADEDSSTSSAASERERELVQRLRRIEFLRQREWMRRVVAWVDGISHETVSDTFPSFPGIRRQFLMSAMKAKTITDMKRALFIEPHTITVFSAVKVSASP
jgi:hypothetical protein